jgi:hypothetical protein
VSKKLEVKSAVEKRIKPLPVNNRHQQQDKSQAENIGEK